ncbi:hypothetical protein F2Q69_00010393 [Brassica cretica]|uniref:Uncharacterized protein n=1 Tax=Brassica cretica TaxID=69181 RepID=A0A8S9QZQ7_BRACR|nr:hypothetical protein F2Q69_00010393 [Brassica cretica]
MHNFPRESNDFYREVNFISVLPLIQKEPGNGRDVIGKISMPAFQIIYPIVKSTYVCVYDQPGDEATLVKQMVSDQSKLALLEYHIDLISESSGVVMLEPSMSIRCFLRFLQNPWKRGSETSGLAMLLVRACGAETFVPWTLLERAGASCLFMLELNFHSRSSITQVRLTSRSDCYRTERGSVPALTRDGDLLGRGFDSACISFVCRVRRLSACRYVMLLPPPKLQAIAPRVFVIGDYAAWLFCKLVGITFGLRDVSVQTADIETLGAIYIDCGVPVMLGGPIGSETR